MYAKYENGDVDPPVKIIVQMCSLYNVSYDFIIEDKLCGSKEKRAEQNMYSHHTNSQGMEVASPVPAFGNPVGYKNKNAKSKSFECVVETLRGIPAEQFPAILAFVDFLKFQNQEKPVSGNALPLSKSDGKKQKSMNAFFDLAGKIDLSADDLVSFRENSLI